MIVLNSHFSFVFMLMNLKKNWAPFHIFVLYLRPDIRCETASLVWISVTYFIKLIIIILYMSCLSSIFKFWPSVPFLRNIFKVMSQIYYGDYSMIFIFLESKWTCQRAVLCWFHLFLGTNLLPFYTMPSTLHP